MEAVLEGRERPLVSYPLVRAHFIAAMASFLISLAAGLLSSSATLSRGCPSCRRDGCGWSTPT